MLSGVTSRAHGARWVLAALAGFALLFAPGRGDWQADRAGAREPIEARILAPTVSEAFVGVTPKPSAPDLRSGAQHRSRPIASPLGVISAVGAISFMWAASAARDRPRIGPRFIALPACVPRGPPAF
jgi:hypothetical protein